LIAIIDYGMGNLASVEKAFKFLGYDAVITSDTEKLMAAEGVVLPGVGAFGDAMRNLEKMNLTNTIKKIISENRPFLGICLGMQLLFDYSEEGGKKVEGLGIFKGSVKQFKSANGLKVPHMGWNSVSVKSGCSLFEGLQNNPYVYFVHSFYLDAEDRNIVIAVSDYGVCFDAAIGKGKVYATQFHPEKSGDIGLAILNNWIRTNCVHV